MTSTSAAATTGNINTKHKPFPAPKLEAQQVVTQDAAGLEHQASFTGEPSLEGTVGSAGTTDRPKSDWDAEDLGEAVFLSFEDWKKRMLEKNGLHNSHGGQKHPYSNHENRKTESENFHNHLDSLGDDGEIDINFSAFRGSGGGKLTGKPSVTNDRKLQGTDEVDGKRTQKDQYRSRDAGKTCKERFSYASFDAGATVLKTHLGAKNAKAVLVENKDSYMLTECAKENKFLIIELSEDIWIDTVVIANFEFFSSMIRTFRVSASDRYPVKMEKWKDLGTYVARNSREIQAFLIENPQIWARYVRIEFVDHYGNEYYCPLSLVRVHGTRMLESWKETEASGDDDDTENDENHVNDDPGREGTVDTEQRGEPSAEAYQQVLTPTEEDAQTTAWTALAFNSSDKGDRQRQEMCLRGEAPVSQPPGSDVYSAVAGTLNNPEQSTYHIPLSIPAYEVTIEVSTTSRLVDALTVGDNSLRNGQTDRSDNARTTKTTSSSGTSVSSSQSLPTGTANKSSNNTLIHKSRPSSTSSASTSLPTIQESFFKAVSRRLQLLETNSTLSLKYIEEQSRILREAFSKVERKQMQKTSAFLESLNSTILSELHAFRLQYDEIWQSTTLSLESQKAESRGEILAISARLNILADEIVFQKRMSIVQSVLLLLCLGLVIFSRVSAYGNLEFPAASRPSRNSFLAPLESPAESATSSPTLIKQEDQPSWLLQHREEWPSSAASQSQSRESSVSAPQSPNMQLESALLTQPPRDALLTGSSTATTPGQFKVLERSHSSKVDWNVPAQPGSKAPAVAPGNLSQPRNLSEREDLSPRGGPPLRGSENHDVWNHPGVGHDPVGVWEASSRRQLHFRGVELKESLDFAPMVPAATEETPPCFSIHRKPLPALPGDES